MIEWICVVLGVFAVLAALAARSMYKQHQSAVSVIDQLNKRIAELRNAWYAPEQWVSLRGKIDQKDAELMYVSYRLRVAYLEGRYEGEKHDAKYQEDL